MYKHESIAAHFRENIQSKTLKSNEKLPALRETAQVFSTSIGTVREAYSALERENFIYAVPKKGYFVLGGGPACREAENPIDFFSGALDSRSISYDDFRHCINKAVNLYYDSLFHYSQAQGLPDLIETLQHHLAEHQVHARPENIVVTSGSQQALDLLNRMPFPNGKSKVLVEQPTYYGMVKNLKICRTPRIGILRGPEGLPMDELERIFRYDDIKFFYTIPRYHNPTGQSYTKKERERLVALAERYNVYIVEDDIAAEFEMNPKRDPLYFSDMCNKVIYLKSFSKILMPGLRLAAVVLPPLLMNTFLEYKQWTDTFSATLSQGGLSIFLASGLYQKNQQVVRELYAKRMRKLREVVEARSCTEIRWSIPDSGFFACLRLESGVPFEQVQPLFYKNNIRMMNMKDFFLDEFKNDNYFRISVSKANEAEIEIGVNKLLDILLRQMHRP